jgi:hypothetical protein
MTELINSFKLRKIDFSLHLLGLMFIIVSGYSIWSTSYEQKEAGLSLGKITTCQGSCKFRTPVDYFWLDARGEQSVVDKSIVFTPGQSKASILLNSGSRLTLYPNSLVQITTNQKGASIDIIEGKVNFEKNANSNVTEKLSIKGKEIYFIVNESSGPEISVTPELLVVEIPEKVLLKDLEASIKISIKNGKPPFQLKIEDQFNVEELTSKSNDITIKLSRAGITGVKILDAAGQISTKMIQVDDLRLPSISFPKNGDIVYTKNFLPFGKFDTDFTEFRIRSGDQDVYLGNHSQIPRNLKNSQYSLSARVKRGENFSDWTQPVTFLIVQSMLPQVETVEKQVFFNRASLNWKKSIPAIHKLLIRDSSGKENINLTTNVESYHFETPQSGRYSWLVEPLFNDSKEKGVWQNFYFVNPQSFLIGPENRKVFVSDELTQKVEFIWNKIPSDVSNLSLEIRAKEFKKVIDVTGLNQYELDLPVLKNYRWKILFNHSNMISETPELSFKIDAPPPLDSIRSEEILIKD